MDEKKYPGSPNVFVLYFVGPDSEGHSFGKFFGVYSSQGRAARAVERLQSRSGYSHYPKGFQVECVRLDEDYLDNPGPPPPIPIPPPK